MLVLNFPAIISTDQTPVAVQDFINRNKLPQAYLQSAQRWFEPLLQQFADRYAVDTSTQIMGTLMGAIMQSRQAKPQVKK